MVILNCVFNLRDFAWSNVYHSENVITSDLSIKFIKIEQKTVLLCYFSNFQVASFVLNLSQIKLRKC